MILYNRRESYDPIYVPNISELDFAMSGFHSSNIGNYGHDFDNVSCRNFKDDLDENINFPMFNDTDYELSIHKDYFKNDIEENFNESSIDDNIYY